jgi:glyceraldehyde 3-phosphate dehydrogenase
MTKIAINGFGRIGRAAFKIILETPGLQLVAINDLFPPGQLSYLLKYDTVYGRYEKEVEHDEGQLIVEGSPYKVIHEKDPAQLPWENLNVKIVFECTGLFTKQEDLEKHISAGAERVMLSAPAKSEETITVVHGVNKAPSSTRIFSCASCTTNCLAPLVEIVGRRIGVQKAMMTTVHAYTSTQKVVDGPSKKLRRGRAAACNFVPTSTGAAIATTQVLPSYKGKFDGVAVRGPVPVGSLVDIIYVTEKKTSVEEVNQVLKDESEHPRYKGIVSITEEPIVSSDIIKNPSASIVDLAMTRVVDGNLVKIMSWYDNEWGYASQMVKEALRVCRESAM